MLCQEHGVPEVLARMNTKCPECERNELLCENRLLVADTKRLKAQLAEARHEIGDLQWSINVSEKMKTAGEKP